MGQKRSIDIALQDKKKNITLDPGKVFQVGRGEDSTYRNTYIMPDPSLSRKHFSILCYQDIKWPGYWETVIEIEDLGSNNGTIVEWEEALTASSAIEDKPSSPASSSPAYGGIDFTRLPIVTQAITNLSSSPLMPSSYLSLLQLNLSEECLAMQRLASSGISPHLERLKSFLQASCLQDKIGEEKDKVLGLLASVLRDEESSLRPTGAGLRDILVALESSVSPQHLKEIFMGKIN